jgi:spore coat polysaccharide biosynthesis protein SpsF
MMLSLCGYPLIDWVLDRVRRSVLLDDCVLATSTAPGDEVLARHAAARGVSVFRGPEDDVLERFRQAAAAYDATHIVRICADNPLVWGEEIDRLIRFYHETGCDYAYNHIPRGNKYPDGLGAETVSRALLETIAREASLPAHREHCFSYLWANPDRFSLRTFDPDDPRLHRPDMKLDVDTAEDYRKLALLPLRPDISPLELVSLLAKETS